MKIGFVFDDSLDFPDGVQQYILMLGESLAARGNDVHYLVGETKRTDLVNVHSLSRNVKVSFNGNVMRIPLPTSRKKIRELLDREDFDILHVCAPFSPFMAAKVVEEAPADTRIVSTFLIAPASQWVARANRALGIMNRRALKRVDQHVSLSAVARDFAEETHRVNADLIIPSPVRLSEFQGAEPIRGDKRRILFLGRLVERKGCAKLLDAVAWAEKRPGWDDVEVVIAGDGPLRAQLEAQAAGLQTPVEFLGFVDEEQKAGLLKGADVVVFASTGGESFGIVLIEAFAADARVVVAGDNPGYRSTVEGNEDILVDVQNPRVFGERLLQALNDVEFAQRVHDWQSQHVEKFDLDAVTDRILQVYQGR